MNILLFFIVITRAALRGMVFHHLYKAFPVGMLRISFES
jgi:hypothetical protein